MRRVSGIAEVREAVRAARRGGATVALVPTMGALHDGHLRLVERARTDATYVVVSVFVNPLQFGPGEDFGRYPRDAEGDAAKVRSAGAQLLFMPAAAELYPREARVSVVPVGLGDRWEGPIRPGHFAGVLTVVLKLFGIVQPDVAVFGQKDFQQATLVRAMVEDLDVPVRVVVEPTVREADGLALSSRNRYLTADERRTALRVPQALRQAARTFAAGERDARAVEAAARTAIEGAPDITVDYLAVVDPLTLEPVPRAAPGHVVLLAVRVGRTRLLDNLVLGS
jgi:pantoate--beta-alanine ligase